MSFGERASIPFWRFSGYWKAGGSRSATVERTGESLGAIYRGTSGVIIDESQLDVPTFLRRKAD